MYVNIANAAPLSALTKSGGSWALSLSMARRTDLSAFIQYDTQVAIINLLVQAGSQGTASVITSTNNDSPVPDITLGKSQDFRPLAAAAPAATDSGKKSGFGLEPLVAQVATDSGEVTLDNPSFDGEIINATQPAFIGSGPPGTVLAIEVHSTNPLTGSAKIDEQGNWEYTLTKGLDPGQHEVTISYMDADKKEQVIKRNFVIAAPGDTDIPAITATQAASTDTGLTRMPSTSAGVPHPGSGEVSLLMLLTGLGLLIGGLKIKNVV